MVVLFLSLLAAAGFFVSTLLVETAFGASRAFHRLSMVAAAGILLGVAFADLVPETFELLGGTKAALSIAAGFIALYMVETLTGGHTHHHEPHVGPEGAHGHGHAHAHAHSHGPTPTPPVHLQGDDPADESCVPTHAVVPFLLGLGLHNFADGVVIGASHEVSDAAATGVAVGILVHQLPVGLSFAAVLLASGVSQARVRRDAVLVAALIPLGALVVLAIPGLSSSAIGVLIGAAAGALVYIATGHLLPEAHSEERRPGLAVAFTLALVGTVLFVGALHDTAHGEDGDAHAGDAHGHDHDEADGDDAHGD